MNQERPSLGSVGYFGERAWEDDRPARDEDEHDARRLDDDLTDDYQQKDQK